MDANTRLIVAGVIILAIITLFIKPKRDTRRAIVIVEPEPKGGIGLRRILAWAVWCGLLYLWAKSTFRF